MATLVKTQEWSPRRIAAWLRKYKDWYAELHAGAPSNAFDYSKVRVMGGPVSSGGAPQARALEVVELERKVGIIRRWLGALTPLERVAANYWIEDRNALEVAAELRLEPRTARALVTTLPLIIWAKFYDPTNKRALGS